MTLDAQTISTILDLRDDLGVLSVYVGITPDRAAEPQPGWPIAIKNELRDLRQRAKDEWGHDRFERLESRLGDLEGDLDRLADPQQYGRGRALFAPLSSDDVYTVSIQVPFQDRAVVDRNAFVRPLVAAYDEGRPAGIAVIHKHGVRVLEWGLGEAEELTNEVFSIGGRDWRKKSGPAPAQPQDTREGGQKRDQFEERVDENRLRFVRERAREVAEFANARGWDRLVIAGDARLTKPFADELNPAQGEQLLVTDLSWEDEAPNVIAEQAWDTFKNVRQERMVQLVDEVRDRALSGGAGALGLDDVLTSLNEGRVERLLFDVDVSLQGYETDEGFLYPNNDRPETGDATPVPLLVERMIDRAVETSARVTPVDHDAAEQLREHGGVGALLRW